MLRPDQHIQDNNEKRKHDGKRQRHFRVCPARTTSQRIKSIFSGSVGNLVEWYDWYVYAAFSLYFAKAFFPRAT